MQEAEKSLKFFRGVEQSATNENVTVEFQSIQSLVSAKSVATKVTISDFCKKIKSFENFTK